MTTKVERVLLGEWWMPTDFFEQFLTAVDATGNSIETSLHEQGQPAGQDRCTT